MLLGVIYFNPISTKVSPQALRKIKINVSLSVFIFKRSNSSQINVIKKLAILFHTFVGQGQKLFWKNVFLFSCFLPQN